MNFKEYLLEMPRIDNDIKPVPNAVSKAYERASKSGDCEDYKFKSYVVEIYDDSSMAFLVKDGVPLLMTEYSMDDYFDHVLFQNESLEKGITGKLEKNLVAEFVVYLAKKLNCDGIISDMTQSIGGQKTWEIMIDLYGDGAKEVGVYDGDEVENVPMKSGETAKDWFMRVKNDVYGEGYWHSRFQLYILF